MAKKKTETVTPETGPEKKAPPKTACPITREEFREHAKPFVVDLPLPDGGRKRFALGIKEFSSGSLGWFDQGKVEELTVNGKTVKVQYQMQFTIVNSKELPGREES